MFSTPVVNKSTVAAVNDFRNRRVARGDARFKDAALAETMPRECASLLADLRAL